ncbi:MAG: 5,6-dimethylbenzimidazole synthase [Pseudomonadota bacterium]
MEFGPDLQEGLSQLFKWRRDVRHFCTEPVPEDLIARLLAEADLAPSVGLSQPWRWVHVTSASARQAVRANFEAANAEALDAQAAERQALYARLKLAGLDTAPHHIAVFCDESTEQGAGLGQKTMPEMRRYSVVCAVFQLWLAARAAGVGVGWVSILDPARLTTDLDVPPDWHFVAYLCLGYPAEITETPELQRQGWEERTAILPLTR